MQHHLTELKMLIDQYLDNLDFTSGLKGLDIDLTLCSAVHIDSDTSGGTTAKKSLPLLLAVRSEEVFLP